MKLTMDGQTADEMNGYVRKDERKCEIFFSARKKRISIAARDRFRLRQIELLKRMLPR